MIRGSLILLIATQLAVFLGTLSIATTGLITGEAAACAAIVIWFVAGLPLSYAVADAAEARRARRDAVATNQVARVQAPSSAV
jgi:hypothetical protein